MDESPGARVGGAWTERKPFERFLEGCGIAADGDFRKQTELRMLLYRQCGDIRANPFRSVRTAASISSFSNAGLKIFPHRSHRQRGGHHDSFRNGSSLRILAAANASSSDSATVAPPRGTT